MSNRKDWLLSKIINDKAKNKVKWQREKADAAIKAGESGDKNLKAYLAYRDKYYEIATKYPNWDKVANPIDYSRFVLDYNEDLYASISMSDQTYASLTPPEVYALKMHGVNERALGILQEKLIELDSPGSRDKWNDPIFFRSHIQEAFMRLRELVPDDEEYDQIFSPKEETTALAF